MSRPGVRPGPASWGLPLVGGVLRAQAGTSGVRFLQVWQAALLSSEISSLEVTYIPCTTWWPVLTANQGPCSQEVPGCHHLSWSFPDLAKGSRDHAPCQMNTLSRRLILSVKPGVTLATLESKSADSC